MKKIIIAVTVFSLIFGASMGVWADTEFKDVNVILSETPAVVNVGETIEMTAVTTKHGSCYYDSWGNAVKVSTVYDLGTNAYISKALFTAEKPGSYNISYTIKMTSGNSDTVFYKTVERQVEVIDTVTVVGALIKDLTVTPLYNADDTISAYKAYGTVHVLWSDNTTTPNGSLYFFFGPEETSKDIEVTLYVDGIQYKYIVTVNR